MNSIELACLIVGVIHGELVCCLLNIFIAVNCKPKINLYKIVFIIKNITIAAASCD